MAVVRKIADISLVAEINRSPQTTVYRGFQESKDRWVLVKVLSTQYSSDHTASQAILKEARLVSRIKHPNVVSLYSFGESDMGNYIVTEFIDGLDLAELVARSPIPAELACFILFQTAQGLQAAHKQNILHRDIKPSNIMISNRGEVKLTDFGMASPRHDEDLSEACGTLPYFAPEQILGQPQDHFSDIFSLGATFYEILAGLPAFQGKTVNDFFQSILNDDPTGYLSNHRGIPEKLVDLCKAMLEKKCDSRLQNCDQLTRQLAQLQDKKLLKSGAGFLEQFVQDPESYQSQEDYLNLTTAPPRQRNKTAYRVAGFAIILISVVLYSAFSLKQNEPIVPEAKTADSGLAATDSLAPPPVTGGTPEQQAPVPAPAVVLAKSIDSALPVVREDAIRPDSTKPVAPVSVPTVKPLRIGPGFLDITCIPWSYVYVDDDSIGMTPLQTHIELTPGSHRVTFKNPNFPLQQIQIEIEEGKTEVLQFSFWATVGRLKLKINPWAEVYIDKQYKDTIPPQEEPIVLSPGSHLLTLKHPSIGEWETTIDVLPAKTLELQFNLRSLIPQ